MTTAPMQHDRNWLRARTPCVVAAVIALAIVALLCIWSAEAVLRGYLAAIVLWLGLPLGAMLLRLTHQLTGGRWGAVIGAPLDAAIALMPVFAALVIPALLGLELLYPWTHKVLETPGSLVQFKQAYLDEPFFIVRSVAYLLTWALLSVWLRRRMKHARDESKVDDDENASADADAGRGLAGLAIVVLVLTISFAFIDWVGTLEPHWYSSVYGMYHIIGQVLFALAVLIIIMLALQRNSAGADSSTLGDLAGLLLAAVVLYAYMAYSQFFIIWNGNLPHEIEWYLHRTRGGWGAVIVALLIIQFALPMAALLLRRVKRHTKPLLTVAAVLVAARVLDCGWMVLPAFDQLHAATWIAAVLAALGIGAAGGSIFIGRLHAADAPQMRQEGGAAP